MQGNPVIGSLGTVGEVYNCNCKKSWPNIINDCQHSPLVVLELLFRLEALLTHNAMELIPAILHTMQPEGRQARAIYLQVVGNPAVHECGNVPPPLYWLSATPAYTNNRVSESPSVA